MKTSRITIKVIIPKGENPWKGLHGKHFSRATDVYNFYERQLLGFDEARLKTKTKVIIDYGVEHPSEPKDWINEGLYNNSSTALYSLACFLEDYISHDFMRSKRRLYYEQEK